MAKCRFRFEVGKPAETIVPEIRRHVERTGGRFEGGRFHLPTPVGEFEGDYLLDGNGLVIEVTEKPFFVPCSAIETRLAEYLRKPPE